MFALAIIAVALSTYSTTLARHASELFSENKYVALINGLTNPFRTRHLLLKSGLPVYDLSISKQQYSAIEHAIKQAEKQGWMDDTLKVWADAKFFFGGEEYKVKVRVRGDLPNHWSGPKKSWRIKFGKTKIEHNGKASREPLFFQGKRQINLIIPQDRRFILPFFVNSILRDYSLVVPRDQFVVLRINGAIQGLYYEVEHFDKPLLVAHQRPETAVFGQNDRAMHFDQYTNLGAVGVSDARFDIGSIRRLVDREGELGMRAMQVLIDHSVDPTPENLRRVRTVLDWEKYLRLRALTTLLNTNHVRFGSDNLRLYFDESRGLLEPIPWDLKLTRMPKEPGTVDFWNSHGPDEIQRGTLTDPELRLHRNKILWELVAGGGEALLAKYDAIHTRIRPLAWADVLSTPIQGHKMDAHRDNFIYNVRRAHKVLELSSANLTYRLEENGRAALEITATNFSGIELREIKIAHSNVFEGTYELYEDANNNGELDGSDPLFAKAVSRDGTVRFPIDRQVLPNVRYGNDFIDGQYWEFFDTLAGRVRFFLVGKLAPEKRHPLDWTPPSIEVAAVNAVTGTQMPSALLRQNEPLPENYIAISVYDASYPFDLEAPERTLAEFLKGNPQFVPSEQRPGAAELSGRVTLSGTVIVPKSVPLILKPGTELIMMPGASVLSYGGFTAIGTPGQRIRVHGDGSGDAWGVFAAVRPPQPVTMKYTDVEGGGQARINGILFTGGLAVHHGDLHMGHCRFTKMQSEDAVNLKNGHIVMNECVIASSASDGMDLDFVTGEVRNSTFLGVKGDGLDLSGSNVLVAGNRFENIGDKGISVGENSHPTVINNLFRRCQIALSTKDLSWAKVAHSTFVDNALAIEAKRKKPMFGGAGGEFVNNVFSGNKVLIQEDYFSKGKVLLESSLVDSVMTPCESCETAEIRFLSSGEGDYRLAPETRDGDPVTIAQVAWAKVELDADGSRTRRVGIVGHLQNPAVMHE